MTFCLPGCSRKYRTSNMSNAINTSARTITNPCFCRMVSRSFKRILLETKTTMRKQDTSSKYYDEGARFHTKSYLNNI